MDDSDSGTFPSAHTQFVSRRVCLCGVFVLCVDIFCYIQAREYAKAIKATLFFSSAIHNINVNKIFKFLVAKLFNLPWSVERNLTPGEPVIDY